MPKTGVQLLLIITFLVGGVLESQAAKRVALVIGNSAYAHTRKLPNPGNDATAIADKLKALGFDRVTLRNDLGYRDMRRTIRTFGSQARSADVAVVYFAGHGLEVGGQNYLVPTDAKLQSDNDLEYEAVTLGSVLREVRSARKLRLVILDSCRNNPLSSTMQLSQGITRSVTRGFSRIEPEGDVLVAYAAKHGTVAADGDATHSPYTAALLKHIPEPGIDIRRMLGKVRDSVRAATSGRQVPHTYGSLGGGHLYLVPPSGQTEPAARQNGKSLAKRREPSPQPPQRKRVPVCDGIVSTVRGVQRCLKVGQSFRDCDDCPTMVAIPAGNFLMGDTRQRKVTIGHNLAVGKFEISEGDWHACVMTGDCKAGKWRRKNYPKTFIFRSDIETYLDWLSKRTGKRYRLLSEAEWEYAARARTSTKYFFGSDASQHAKYAWTILNATGNLTAAQPAGVKLPNGFGLHDMYGNAMEIVADCWHASLDTAPSDGSAWKTDCEGEGVLRGGGTMSPPFAASSASRVKDIGSRLGNKGFRIARTL